MLQRWFPALLCSVFWIPAAWASSSEINEKFKDDDPRLQQKVTISPSNVLLDDLLAALYKRTGVLIEEDPRDQAAGTEILISCQGTPVCDLLDGIWSLLSNSDSKYRWYRELRTGGYVYTFYEPDAVKQRPATLNYYALKAYEKYVDTICDLSQLTPEQRSQRKGDFKSALLDTDPQAIETMFNTESFWKRYALFSELVPRESRSSVLLGQQTIDVPVATASDRLKSLFAETWDSYHVTIKQPDGSRIPAPMPTSIQVSAVKPRSTEVVPTVMIQLGSLDRISLISTMRLGVGLKDIVKQRWLLPADSATAHAEIAALKAPAVNKAEPARQDSVGTKMPPVGRVGFGPGVDPAAMANIARLSGAGIGSPSPTFGSDLLRLCGRIDNTVLAIVPPGYPPNRDSSSDKSIGDYVKRLEARAGSLMHKWRGEILLVSYPQWFFSTSASTPYHIVKEFPTLATGQLDLSTLVKLVGKTNEAEFSALCGHYRSLQNAEILWPILLQCRFHPQILKADGWAVEPETLRFLQSVPVYAVRPEIRSGQIERARMTESALPTKDPTNSTVIRFEGLVAGHWKLIAAMVQIPAGQR